ncbi:glycosyltransferase [Paracoccaceae bacterium GXU_MW_L88]
MSDLTLAAIVVTFNRKAQLDTTVARLLAESVDHVVIVDNNSTDGTRDWLKSLEDPRVTVIYNEENLGGAGGFEIGLREAVARFDPDWCVVMDDDARPQPGAFDAFRSADLTRWDAVVAAVYHPDGRICEMNRPALNPFWHKDIFREALTKGRAGFHIPDARYDEPPSPLDEGSFVGLFLSRKAIEIAGYPDRELFIYGDDVLYTLTLTERGGRIGFVPQVRFEHAYSTQSEGSIAMRPLWKNYYHYRNLLFVYRKAAGPWFYPALLAILPKWYLKFPHYGADKGAFLKVLTKAVRHGLTGKRGRLPEHGG